MSPGSEISAGENYQSENEEPDQTSNKAEKVVAKRRTKTGCLTCRKRRIKCGEERPVCKNCIKSKRECAGYNPLIYQPQGIPLSVPAYNQRYAEGPVDYPNQFIAHHDYDMYHHPGSVHYERPIPAMVQPQVDSSYEFGHIQHPPGPHPALEFQTTYEPTHWPSLLPEQRISNAVSTQSVRGILEPHHGTLPASVNISNGIHLHPQYQLSGLSQPGISGTSSTMPTSLNVLSSTSTQHQVYGFHNFSRGSSSRTRIDMTGDPETTVGQNSIANMCTVEDPEDPFDVGDESDDARDTQRVDHSMKQGRATRLAMSSSKPKYHDSPFLEERSQHIFRHFLTITGPCMSIFDRLEDLGMHRTPKMVWTHGLPAMSFNHPALAHAILSIGAVQLARLDQGSQETADKHFMIALRRAGKLLGSQESRHHVSTLATILLLAYYEVIAGDHSRWCLHLSGAARLVMEHNHAAARKTVRRMRARAKSNIGRHWTPDSGLSDRDFIHIADIPEALLDDGDWEVDQHLISRLVGMEVDYDRQIQPGFHESTELPDLTTSEVSDLKILMEMYWWYCKQDVFQSMLSGDAPMLSYSKWKYGAPRGPIGRADRPHATADHLWLLMARLTTFGAKDRIRKQRVVASQGGEWIPAPGFLPMLPRPTNAGRQQTTGQVSGVSFKPTDLAKEVRHETRPTANEGRSRKTRSFAPTGPAAPLPSMYGMIPPPNGPVHMSTSFKAMNDELQRNAGDTPESAHSTETPNLEQDLARALEEHTLIAEAFELFVSCLGSDFEPLTMDQWATTPFGPALQYRSPTIATMWTFYHVGRILLRRLHPHSPPAAMVSAGVNASSTHESSQIIGRICGGLFAQNSRLQRAGGIDHMLTAAMTETTFSLLFAAVQYQEPAQRGWTINKLSEVAKQTGWASSSAVAAACETTWERAGAAGRGPFYRRTLDKHHSDARVRGRTYDLSSNTGTHKPQRDALKEHESRFVSHDRALIVRHGSTRAYWALGLLSVEEDLEKMDLNQNQDEPNHA